MILSSLPHMPRGAASIVRTVVGGIPAMLLVLVGVLILWLRLFLVGPGRQRYALRAATSAFGTARALVGLMADGSAK